MEDMEDIDKRPARFPYKRNQRPTIRERRYVKNLFNPKNKTSKQAALDAGFSNPPHGEAVTIMIKNLMTQSGLSDKKLVDRLKRFIFKARDEDNAVKALRMAFELKDYFPANRKPSELSLSQINIYKEMDIDVLTRRVGDLLERVREEESKNRPLLPNEAGSGLQRPDGDIPQGTLPESSNGK